MKRFRLIGVVLAIILYANFSACSSDPIVPEVTVEMGNEDYFAKNMDFDSSAGEKTFSFTSNVEWSVAVAPTMNGETWCTVTPNSGKDGNNIIRVKVQENTGYDDRNVVLTLTAGSTLTKTITVTQKQKDAILLTTNKFEVEPQGGKINIEVKANVDYEAIISESCKSWISLASKSRGLTTSNITFDIAETEEYDKREGEIIIKSGDLSETVHIYQTGQEILLLTKNEYPVSDKGETIAVEIKSNFTFDVQMPNADWVVDESKSRGVSSHTLYYTILPNETYDSREAEIIFYDKNSSIKDTLKIIQAQKDAIILNKKNYEVESKGGIIEVELNANVNFDISIDSTWVKPTEQTSSRGLVNHKLYFQINENSTYDARSAHIMISDKNKVLEDTITILQSPQPPIYVEVAEAGTLLNYLNPDSLDLYKSIRINGCLNGTDFVIIKRMNNLKVLDLEESRIVEGGLPYSNNYQTKNDIVGRELFYSFGNEDDPCHIILPQGIIAIEADAFEFANIRKIDLPNTIKTIGTTAFWCCTQLETLELPESIEEINYGAFADCNILEKIVVPKNVRKIGRWAFGDCEKLKEIHIKALPETLTEIGDIVFRGVYDSATLYIPQGTKDAYYYTDFGNFKKIVEE